MTTWRNQTKVGIKTMGNRTQWIPQLHCQVLALIAAHTWHVSATFERAIIGVNTG